MQMKQKAKGGIFTVQAPDRVASPTLPSASCSKIQRLDGTRVDAANFSTKKIEVTQH